MNYKKFLIYTLTSLIMLLLFYVIFICYILPGLDIDKKVLKENIFFEAERTDGGFFTFIDINSNKELDRTARMVFEGDKLLLSDNSLYEVKRIEGDKVFCQFIKKEKISLTNINESRILTSELNNKSVAIYSTHTDESYVPTSGAESEPGNGDVLQVNKTMATVLRNKGIKTFYSLNKHDPHDANAYQRSRRTAVQLLRKRPSLIIDVHRDGVPDPKFYSTTIDDKNAVKIRLVVGRQNQNMQANLDLAKKMKAFYDEKKPGLIKGIFIAKGNYNQDLAPRSILIEVGTYTNSLETARNGVIAFSSLLPEFLGLQGIAEGNKFSTGDSSAIIWLLMIILVGGLAFLLISRGSLKGALEKMQNISNEITSLIDNIKGGRKK